MLASELMGLTANDWSALGIWLTLAVYIALALFAKRQLAEARDLRIQQARPFVVVDVVSDEKMLLLSVSNIGSTLAQNLSVRFDRPLQFKEWPRATWTESPLFHKGMPSLAPGRELRFALGEYPREDVDKRIKGTVSYDGPEGLSGKPHREEFNIDIGALEGSQPQRDSIVRQLECVVDALKGLKPQNPPYGWMGLRSNSDTVEQFPIEPRESNCVAAWIRGKLRRAPTSRSR